MYLTTLMGHSHRSVVLTLFILFSHPEAICVCMERFGKDEAHCDGCCKGTNSPPVTFAKGCSFVNAGDFSQIICCHSPHHSVYHLTREVLVQTGDSHHSMSNVRVAIQQLTYTDIVMFEVPSQCFCYQHLCTIKEYLAK